MRFSEMIRPRTTRYRLLCDGCGQEGLSALSKREAIDIAQDNRWYVSDLTGRCLCHACALKEEVERADRT